jgi:hypothetical protein
MTVIHERATATHRRRAADIATYAYSTTGIRANLYELAKPMRWASRARGISCYERRPRRPP